MTEKPNLSRKQIAQIPLSAECKSIILGSILGDSSLKKEPNYANVRFKFRHSIAQQDHFYWKVNLLQEISTPKSVQPQKPDGYSTKEKLLFQSSALPQITELWKLVCNNGNTLVIKRKWLNHLTELSLAAWWFDDGSILKATRQGIICSDDFSKEECEILKRYLLVVWNIVSKVRPLKRYKDKKHSYSKDIYYRLWFNTTEVKKFIRIVLPYAVTSFAVKKCFLVYKDPNFQQRWISEMRKFLSLEGLHRLDNLLQDFNKENPLGLGEEEKIEFLDSEERLVEEDYLL